jgi:DNA-binding protein HU-beta
MSKSVTKADLVATMAAEADLKKVQAERALAALTTAIQGALVKGHKVTLVGFGTFSVATRAERTGRNPQTKKAIRIPSSKSVKFKPGKAMKDAVNR